MQATLLAVQICRCFHRVSRCPAFVFPGRTVAYLAQSALFITECPINCNSLVHLAWQPELAPPLQPRSQVRHLSRSSKDNVDMHQLGMSPAGRIPYSSARRSAQLHDLHACAALPTQSISHVPEHPRDPALWAEVGSRRVAILIRVLPLMPVWACLRCPVLIRVSAPLERAHRQSTCMSKARPRRCHKPHAQPP